MKLTVITSANRTEIKISKSLKFDHELILRDGLEKLKVKHQLFFQEETKKIVSWYIQKKISNAKRILLEKHLSTAFNLDYKQIVNNRMLDGRKEPKTMKEVKTSNIISGYSGCPITGIEFKFNYVH